MLEAHWGWPCGEDHRRIQCWNCCGCESQQFRNVKSRAEIWSAGMWIISETLKAWSVDELARSSVIKSRRSIWRNYNMKRSTEIWVAAGLISLRIPLMNVRHLRGVVDLSRDWACQESALQKGGWCNRVDAWIDMLSQGMPNLVWWRAFPGENSKVRHYYQTRER